MGSQTLSILRQGVWASLTGGWFYDPKQSHFSNVFHLYLWLILLCLPFTIHILTDSSDANWSIWIGYCVGIGALFTIIKLSNAYLHRLFDHGECVIEETSSHKSDEDINLNNVTIIEHKDRIASQTNEHREHIEMMVLGSNENGSNGICNESHNNNDENSPINDEYFDRIALSGNTAPSVIDLEVDVHHRNSSGSSIGVSDRSKCHNVEESDHFGAKVSKNNSPSITIHNENNRSANDNIVHNPFIDSSNVIGLSSHNADISASCDVLVKGNSLELGFMAQDPGVLRAAANELQSKAKRTDSIAFRRARSELETAQCSSDKKSSSVPPSHPVSLEVIGTQKDDNDEDYSDMLPKSSLQSSELLRRTTVSLGGTIKPIDELSADEQENRLIASPSNVKTMEADSMPISPVLSDHRMQYVEVPSKTGDKVQQLTNKSSDDGADESDISLVVNYSSKVRKKKSSKVVKQRRALGRRKVSKSTSSGKLSTTKKSSDKFGEGDIGKTSEYFANYDESRKNIRFSSDSEIESSHESSETWTSRSRSLNSSSRSSPSDERTPLTANTSTENKLSKGDSFIYKTPVKSEPNREMYKQVPTHEEELEDDKRFGEPSHNDSMQEQSFELRRRSEQHRRSKEGKRKDLPIPLLRQETVVSNESQESKLSASSKMLDASGASTSATTITGPPAYLLARILSVPGTHLARSHEDTAAGAVHCFQDEHGNWLTYTFDENSTGVARGLMNAAGEN